MAKTLKAADAPSVVFTCGWCGRPVTLAASPIGAEIADLASFLRDHADCLRRGEAAAEPPPDEPGGR